MTRPYFAAGGLALLLALAAAPAGAEGSSRLWRVEGEDSQPSYVFGTFHLPDPRLAELPQPVAKVVAQADSLTLELAPGQMQGLPLILSLLPTLFEMQDLRPLLGEKSYAAFEDIAAQYGIPAEALRYLPPWAVWTVISVPPEAYARMEQGELGVDEQLAAAAEASGVPVYGLETAAEQLAVLRGAPVEQQIAMLQQAIAEHDTLDTLFDRMVEAYAADDLDALDDLVEVELSALDPAAAAYLDDRLIVERNRLMVERMLPRLAEGNAVIAVGAAHLPGEDGILDLLAERGFRVTPIE